MTDEQLRTIHAQHARAFNDRAERNRAARRAQAQGNPLPANTEIEEPISVSEGEAAIAAIKKIKERAGTSHFTILSVEEHETRINHVLEVANQSTKGESMSSQSKPEPPVTVIAEKARLYRAQQHAAGNKFFSVSEAVAHVRKEMGLKPYAEVVKLSMTSV